MPIPPVIVEPWQTPVPDGSDPVPVHDHTSDPEGGLLPGPDAIQVTRRTGIGTSLVTDDEPTIVSPAIDEIRGNGGDVVVEFQNSIGSGNYLTITSATSSDVYFDTSSETTSIDIWPGDPSGRELKVGGDPVVLNSDARLANLPATDTPTADSIPLSLGTGKLAAGWLSEVLALADLSDVTAKTGTGTTVVMSTTPTIATPLFSSYVDLTAIATPSAPAAGVQRFYIDSTLGGLAVDDENGVVIPVLRAQFVRARNAFGGTLTKGSAGYITSGTTGSIPNVNKADADAAATMPAIGLVAANISTLGTGFIQTRGLLSDFDTSAWSAGAVLYPSGTAGALTSTQPALPAISQPIARVIVSNATTGTVEILSGIDISGLDRGTILNTFTVGDGTAGAKTVAFAGTATAQLQWNPTTGKVITLPDSTGQVVLRDTADTLTNKTLTTPIIGDFTTAQHSHANAAGGGTLNASAIAAGTMATARLGSGTASAATFLSGDSTYKFATGGYLSKTTLAVGSGTYTVPAGIYTIDPELIGSGGGGGGAAQTTGQCAAAGGGGAGAYCRKRIATSPGATFAYDIKAGGTGGTAGNNNGVAGLTSTFGSLSSPGGGAGQGAPSATTVQVRNGGSGAAIATGGDINSGGTPGQCGFTLSATVGMGGSGASGPFGGGTVARTTETGGAGAVGPGAGGGGGLCLGTTARVGGVGADGVCTVYEYA